MAYGSGISAQIGYAEESAYGTYTTPVRFLPFENEALNLTIERDEASGLIGVGTTVLRSDRWAAGEKNASGAIKHKVLNKGFGLLFKHMFGNAAITTPGGGVLTRDHTHTLGDLYGKSLTTQVGRPDVGGTVRPFSYLGGKVASWELSNTLKGFLDLTLNMNAADESTSQSLAAASYPAGVTPLHWVGGALTIGGSSYPIRTISVKGDNGIGDDRYSLGSQVKSQPIVEKLRQISGEIESDFIDMTAYDRYVNGSTAAIVATWQGPLIEGSLNYMVQVTMPVCRFDGDTPNVEGQKRLVQKLPFKALDDGTQQPVTLVYRTTDTAS